VRRTLRSVEPTLALFDVQKMDDRIRGSWSRLTQQTRLLGAFALLAFVLAGIGTFAVVVQGVGERRREIGVRAALGASPMHLLASVGRHGALPAAAGAAIGFALSILGGRLIAASVHGAPAFDASVAVGVCTATFVVILLATGSAASRALTVEPSEALRT
jgi:ABC-type antimicrobial peptide transport system permease subunit